MKKYIILTAGLLFLLPSGVNASALSAYNEARNSCLKPCAGMINNLECVKKCPPVKYECSDGSLIINGQTCPTMKSVKEKAPSCGQKFLDFLKSKTSASSCDNLHTWSVSRGQCILSTQTVPLDPDTRDVYEKTVDGLKPNESTTVSGKTRDGKEFSVGIFRGLDGSYSFTKDGINFYDNLKDIINPGLSTRAGNWWSNLTRGIKVKLGWGSDIYVGRDTAGEGGKVNQTEGQMRLDAASAAFRNIQKKSGDPAAREEIGMRAIERLMGGADNLLGGNYLDNAIGELEKQTGLGGIKDLSNGKYLGFAFNRIKAITGCDLSTLKKIIEGKYTDIVFDKTAFVKQLYLFPADSVVTLAKELRTSNFADAASIYMKERASKTSDQIFELMNSGQLPEIDLASNIKGVGKDFAPPVLFSAYEEAYQRYLIAKKLKQ